MVRIKAEKQKGVKDNRSRYFVKISPVQSNMIFGELNPDNLLISNQVLMNRRLRLKTVSLLITIMLEMLMSKSECV